MTEKNPLAVRFGENVCACRNRIGISQEELSRRASLHRTEVGLIERGGREPMLNTIIKLASVLSVRLDELIEGITWGLRGGFEFQDRAVAWSNNESGQEPRHTR